MIFILIQKNKIFAWRWYPLNWISLLLLVLLVPVGFFLPAWYGWENGPIENTQVFILIVGAVLSWLASRRNCDNRKIRNLWLWSIPVWLLMVGRELSWGRVFFDPVSIGPEGPTFPSIHEIWYGQYVYPILSIIIIATLIGLWRNFNWVYIKQKMYEISVLDGVLVIVGAIVSQLIFDRDLIMMLKSYSQMLEEWSELIVYWCMVSIVFVAGFKK